MRRLTALTVAALTLVACVAPTPAPPAMAEDGFRLSFDEQGNLLTSDAETLRRVVAAAHQATDIFIFSHGWWNDPASAECRYSRFINALRARRPPVLTPETFRPVLVGIYWPSAIFPLDKGDCDSGPASAPAAPLESGGSPDLSPAITAWARAAFPTAARRPEFAGELARVTVLLDGERRGARLTQQQGEELTATLMRWRDAGRLGGAGIVTEGPEDLGFTGVPSDVATRWTKRQGGTTGSPTESFGVVKWMEFANVFTFWSMKDRAGIIGSRGVYDLIRALQDRRAQGLRVHLIGHSFGGKLLSAAITGHGREPANVVDSFLIFQGAFSHFAFSKADEIRRLGITTARDGLYAEIVTHRRVTGLLAVTYSRQDQANQVVYPRGVLVSGDFLEATGVARYGSVGADGMQGPAVERVTLATGGLSGRLRPDGPRLFNIDASNVIRGHSDLISDRTVDLVWDVIQATRTR
jgi:hypothetical protein